MGVVWAARHLALETDVAVKLIRPERAAADPALVARFEREARATARIAHPHVVQVMDCGAVDEAVPYLVMELLRGFTLAELLERGGRPSVATGKTLGPQGGGGAEGERARERACARPCSPRHQAAQHLHPGGEQGISPLRQGARLRRRQDAWRG